MGKGYKRKTRWRTLNIGAPPGEEDEEDGIRNGYAKAVENGMSSRNGQTVHKSGRTDSAGSTTSDYASDYASAASRSRRDDSGGSPSQPKVIFNENEYTRITTPRQDVLFKKGYLSRKKVWASTASTSATPSTTESQSASHSTADGSETTEDQQLLDCKENGAEEYPAMGEPGAHVAYGTFYDHASGYYYEYPLMLVGPGGGMPGPAMHNVLTAVPCGPVPLRPIEWVNPAFVPKLGSQQYCVMDYQTAHLAQYPTLVDANGVPLPVPADGTNGTEETCHENGVDTASSWPEVVDATTIWANAVDEEETPVESTTTTTATTTTTTTTMSTTTAETQNGTADVDSPAPTAPATAEDETTENPAAVNPENYLEIALAQQLHVAVPPVPQPYMYPGHYMFGPSLVNVNGVTIQCAPMVRNTGVTGGPTNTGACAKRRRKKKLSKRKSRRPLGPGNAEDEEQEEEDYSSEAENVAGLSQPAIASDSGPSDAIVEASAVVSTSSHRPLNPDCQEFRPVQESRLAPIASSSAETAAPAIHPLVPSKSDPSSITEASENHQRASTPESSEKPSPHPPRISTDANNHQDAAISRIPEATNVESPENLADEEVEATPVEFASEVFANVTNIAERALAPRSVVEGTPMETEIGLDVATMDFKEIVESLETPDEATRSRRRIGSVEPDSLPNGQISAEDEEKVEKEDEKNTETIAIGSSEFSPETSEKSATKHQQRSSGITDQRGSRSASPGMINRTTTPINANTQRLPESYESLVTRGSNASSSASSSSASQTARNRKYSAKGPKFVREATPGPDLDFPQPQQLELEDFARSRVAKTENIGNSESIVINSAASGFENEAIATGIEAIEAEVQRYSVSTSGGSCTDSNVVKLDASNDDSGVEGSQTRGFSSDHPITDAVTEWLQRANSPELFVTSAMPSDSEPEDDEPDEREPSKNLRGNPMPALSANSSVNDVVSSRLASCGEFAKVVDVARDTRTTGTSNDDEDDDEGEKNEDEKTRRNRLSGCYAPRILRSRMRRRSRKATTERKLESSEKRPEIKKIPGRIDAVDVCELAEKDSDAGMRVAKSARTRMMRTEDRGVDESTTVNLLSGRETTTGAENVGVKVRRLTEENDEGIVEDEEVSVRTFEKGEIVVPIGGKVLPVEAYETPVILRQPEEETKEKREKKDEQKEKQQQQQPLFSKITCEMSRRDDEETSGTSEKSASKRNSLGSIEEPDVLECWEVETVEPIVTPKRQPRGISQEGEAAEDDVAVDPAAVEIVRKYYRLEATRDSGASVTSVEEEREESSEKSGRDSLPNSPERMIESLCSEEIPVIGERMSKIVEAMLNEAGAPIDEAVEVYESCYNGKPPNYLMGFVEPKFRGNGTRMFGRVAERDGGAAVRCRAAACCNIQ